MRADYECLSCGYECSKPWPFAICPACGADQGRMRTHHHEPDYDLAGARGESDNDDGEDC